MSSKQFKLLFTGERLIPEYAKGKAIYYEHVLRYLFASQFVKGRTVLDAGCGTGYGSYIMSTFGQAKKIYAVDNSSESIEYASQNFRKKNIVYRIGDVQELKTVPASSIDVIACFEVIEHIKKPELFLERAKEVLRPDGILLVSTPNKYAYPKGNPYHTKEFYPLEFRALLTKYFRHEELYYQTLEFSHMLRKQGALQEFAGEYFQKERTLLFEEARDVKHSQYVLAVCSDKKIDTTIEPVGVTSSMVDGFSLQKGLLSLVKKFNDQVNQKQFLERELAEITSSRFFKLWQSYCQARKFLFGK